MITIITRHPATQEIIAKLLGSKKTVVVPHWDGNLDSLGEEVVGVLPLPMIKQILDSGRKFYLFALNPVPQEMRGKELSEDDIRNIGFKLYEVRDVDLVEIE
ncbi:MAG: CRISPR-associated protein Csx16 [Candidatus Helarchaeota archaeon]